MKPLTHYIVVRRDLPLGVVLANVAHAAGESFFQLGATCRATSVVDPIFEQVTQSGPGPEFNPHEAIAIVLGSKNEGRLRKLKEQLAAAGVAHVAVHEMDGEYAGQLMAIGLQPGPKETLAAYVNEFHMLRVLGLGQLLGPSGPSHLRASERPRLGHRESGDELYTKGRSCTPLLGAPRRSGQGRAHELLMRDHPQAREIICARIFADSIEYQERALKVIASWWTPSQLRASPFSKKPVPPEARQRPRDLSFLTPRDCVDQVFKRRSASH